MRIPDLFQKEGPVFSFEFFPPKNEEGEETLFASLEKLKRLEPDYVSVTYGAGGSTREGTVETCARIQNEVGLETMAHLSCVGETVDGLESLLEQFDESGIENVLALRGDPPEGETVFSATPGGLTGSAELAAFIRERHPAWGIGGSCFPEIHAEADSARADIEYAKEKVDNGAEFLISQLFFDNRTFFEWREEARDAGIEVPIVVGLLPVRTYKGIKRMASLCDAVIPDAIHEGLVACGGDADAERAFGVAYAARQAEELLAAGVDGIHFYTLNQADSTVPILSALKAAEPWKRAGDGILAAP